MSYWTHIVGIIHADTYLKEPNITEVVQNALKDAPQITGSERHASVFVNPEAGYNCWLCYDCFRCNYYCGKCNDSKGGFWCNAPDEYTCPTAKYQTRVIISVQGDLRDRMRAQTRKEWNAFHKFIAKNLGYKIRIATCKITGY